MRPWAIICVISALYETHCAAQVEEVPYSPFKDIQARSPNPLHFLKRQSLCPSGYSSCSSLGNSGACCPSGTNCARDQAGNVACCPVNAVCTGVISGSATRTISTSGFVLGGTSTTAQITTPATLPSGYSTVPNQYYPFVAIPTSYQNAQACLTAYSTCQAASTSCFNSLAGQNGVTIAGLGSLGVTQAGATGSGPTVASSICASLYTRGCYNLQSSVCNSFGTASGQTTGFVQPNGGPAPARCTRAFYTAAAAVLGVGMVQAAMV